MEAVTTPAEQSVSENCQTYSVDEVAKLLKISRTTLFGLVSKKNGPPCIKITSKIMRFPASKLRIWMDKLEQ